MDGDRPITSVDDDKLGFAVVGSHLAIAILDQTARDGFVFGIEGAWGSGKSTLINLTIDALRSKGATASAVVRFSPWLVGDRDTLLRQLFDELASATLDIEPTKTTEPRTTLERLLAQASSEQWRLRQKERAKKRLASKLHAFGAAAGAAGKIAKTAGEFGLVGAGGAGSAAQGSKEAIASFLAGGAVSKRKAEIVTLLAVLSRPIVVFIDDLDRLEPREVSEVLRLIRAVADFPNVIYVVSYDPTVVASTLTLALQVDGRAFLEKIVQVSFKVPLPEAFDLRNWFQSEVNKMVAEPPCGEADSDPRESPASRLSAVVNTLGGQYLKTPRDVVRTLNSLRLHASPVHQLIDFPDLVWLQLIRIGNPELYDWVESYLSEATAMMNGASVTDEDAAGINKRLDEILAAEGGDAERKLIELSRMLPGIDPFATSGGREDRRKLLKSNKLGDYYINPLIADKRLGSPQHYRYYFSFCEPAGALRDEVVRQFLADATAQPDMALATFSQLASQPRPQGGLMADVMIDRLSAISDRISPSAILGILRCFTETMDDIARSSPSSDFGGDRTWGLAEKLTTSCLAKAPKDVRAQALRVLFTDGKSIGWLTEIIRGEIFDHGIFGDRKTPEDQWLLSSNEFDDALNTMLVRYHSAEPEKLMQAPNFLGLLYGWQQGSGTDDARKWVAAQTETTAGLLAVLPRMRSMAYRGRVIYPLNKTDMEKFFDVEDLKGRVQSIIDEPTTNEADRSTATEIMEALLLGEQTRM